MIRHKKCRIYPIKSSERTIGRKGVDRIALNGRIKINRKEYGTSYSKKMDNGGLIVDDYDIELNIIAVNQTKYVTER